MNLRFDKLDYLYLGRVYIQDYSTIGSGSVIFPDITISENSFVGACSMVSRDTEANSIVTGTPAKFLRASILYSSTKPLLLSIEKYYGWIPEHIIIEENKKVVGMVK